MQQQFLITYADKDKERIQTLAATPKEIQLPSWKKHRVESPTIPSYHYTLGSAINISSADVFTSNATSTFGRFHQTYTPTHPTAASTKSTTPSATCSTATSTTTTTTSTTCAATNDDTQTWINDVIKAIVANNWDNARALQAIFYFLQDTTNAWYQSLVAPPQTFQQFKTEFLRYFSNNNSINRLANTFNTIKQEDTEAVTTYLGCFYKNLHQIQAIEANYFTAPQILNQFIRELHSSIFQWVCPIHPANLPTAVTHTKDFEATELEANHVQTINLVMNGSSELDSKLKQFRSCPRNLDTGHAQNPNSQHYLSLLVTLEDTTSNKLEPNQQLLTNTIPPATIFNDKSLAVIFSFELKETTLVPLFNGAASKKNSSQQSASARVITADGATKTLIGKIDHFPFEVNGIVTPIKVLVIEATQYQALVGNDWLSKLTYQGQHIHVPATCGHFKTPLREKLLIELEEAKEKPIWEAYQVSWADADHNKLPPILSWDDKKKRKKKKNLPGEQIRDLEMMTTKVNQPQNGLGKRKKKGRNKKKSQHNLLPLHISHILHNFRPSTVDLNLNASLAVRNCRQWVHVVTTTKTGRQQHDTIVVYVLLNAMADH
ncbi:hypothetical protein G9A89_005739 [Geosiphon pyriformis]|nr:hypothetical protein G9A89_005739 [Geosiphon pyriformis]